MKPLFLLIACLFSISLHSQSFKHKEYYPSGQLQAEYNGKKNAADGLVKIYYETGELQGELNYKKGIQDGKSVLYFTNGNTYKEYFYNDGVQEDTMKIYYENGHLQELSIIKNQEKNGPFKTFFDNGSPEIDGWAKDGIAHGFCTFYKKNGDIWKSGELDMGTPVGQWTVYDEAGVTFKTYSEKRKLACDPIKVGKFSITDKSIPGTTYITRDKNSQLESNETINFKMKYKVEWIDKCVYTLSEPENLSNSKNVSIIDGEVLTVRIFEITEKGYTALMTSSVREFRNTIFISFDDQ